eukprot:scaffold246293_cov14-Tisochrysis_lutea.AAC.1
MCNHASNGPLPDQEVRSDQKAMSTSDSQQLCTTPQMDLSLTQMLGRSRRCAQRLQPFETTGRACAVKRKSLRTCVRF